MLKASGDLDPEDMVEIPPEEYDQNIKCDNVLRGHKEGSPPPATWKTKDKRQVFEDRPADLPGAKGKEAVVREVKLCDKCNENLPSLR